MRIDRGGRRRLATAALVASLALTVGAFASGTAGAAKPGSQGNGTGQDKGEAKPGKGKKKARSLSVYPVPGTPVASDRTTFSFRGVKARNMGPISVFGSKTGRHGGRRVAHSDGRGVSWVPKKPFQPGERVSVRTERRVLGAKRGNFKVGIGDFYGNDDRKAGPGTPPGNDGLHSRPDLKPPQLDVKVSTPAAAPGQFFIAPKQEGLTIADSYGRISWFRPSGFGGKGQSVYNFRKQEYQGKPVLTYWKGASSATGFSQIGEFEILDQSYNLVEKFQPGNGYRADIHEFAISDDKALVLSYRGIEYDLSPWGGPKNGKLLDNVVQEIDIATGAVTFEWHAVGNVRIDEGFGEVPTDGAPFDYFHVNSIQAVKGGFVISGRRTSTVYRIARGNAKIQWKLGGAGNGNFNMGEGTGFGYQHDAQLHPDGTVSLFDNGSGRGVPTVNDQSSGLVLKLANEFKKNRSATLVRRFTHPDKLVADSQGNTDPQENGNYVVGWGSTKRLTEYTPDGQIAVDITFEPSPISSYRAFKDNWYGKPKDRPAITSASNGAGGATVWASWNGKTDIAGWRVLSGPDENSLETVAGADWANLETEIQAGRVDSRVQVVAIDARGEALGASAVVPIGQQSR